MYISQDDLKGRIKKHTTIVNGLVLQVMHFDEKGKCHKIESFRNGILEVLFIIENGTQKTYRYEDNNLLSLTVAVIDDEGDILEESCFDENEMLLWENLYAYDANNRLVSKAHINDHSKVITNYTYDDNNNLIEKTIVSDIKNESFVYLFEYDANHNLTRKTKKRPNGDTIKTQISTFENNLRTTWKKFNQHGQLVKYKICQYNALGQLIRKMKFDLQDKGNYVSNHEVAHFQVYYDAMEAFCYDIDGTKNDTVCSIQFLNSDKLYAYDQFGNQVLFEEYRYRDDFSNQHLTLWRAEYEEYNDKNLLISSKTIETHTDWDWSSGATYSYTFDQAGKMIQKNVNGKPATFYFYNESGLLTKELTVRNDEFAKSRIETLYDYIGNIIKHDEFAEYSDKSSRKETTDVEIEYY